MGPARLSLGTTPLRLFSLVRGIPPAPHHLLHLTHSWQKPGREERMGKGDEHADTQRAEPDSGREGEGSCRLCLPAPSFEVKEKAKAFHISADVQLKQDSKRKGKAGGHWFPSTFPCAYTFLHQVGRRGCSLPCSYYHIFLPHPNPQV